MNRWEASLAVALIASAGGGISACSGSSVGSSPLTASSILDGATPVAAGGPAPASVAGGVVSPGDPSARAAQLAWTTARANKCGFVFGPDKLRSALIAAETAKGATPDVLDKMNKAYDATRTKAAVVLAQDEAFCSKDNVAATRVDLNRHLAGDFSPPPKKVEVKTSFWDILNQGQKAHEPAFDREAVLFPSGRAK